MPSLPLPYTLANGTLADATQVMADFNTLLNAINDGHITAVGTIATGVWHGTPIGPTYGGTGVDLSATGPGVLKQATLGAGVTVGSLSTSDISGLATIATSGSANDLSSGTVATARLPTIPILNGGTAATTVAAAFANIAVAASSIANPGYIKFQNGLIFQWGTQTFSAATSVAVTFPLAFPTALFAVIATPIMVPGGNQTCGVQGQSTTGFNLNVGFATSNSQFWFAVGN